MNKIWFDKAWDDYLYWQSQDKKTLKRINQLIQYKELTTSTELPKRIFTLLNLYFTRKYHFYIL